jgi:hypothetical protein
VFIFGATVKSISDGSVLWENRETFKIVGPVLMTVACLLFVDSRDLKELPSLLLSIVLQNKYKKT